MSKREVKAVLERVLTWPKTRQKDAVDILKRMEERNAVRHRLTPAQAAEVRRRLAERKPKTLTLPQFKKRIRRFGV